MISIVRFFLFLGGLLLSSFAAQAEVSEGQQAPAFVATTLDGKSFDLSALKDKVVVLHFWATWCAPCREEMPALEAVWRKYRTKGLEVLAISADRPRAKNDVRQAIRVLTFPIALLDSASKNDFGPLSSVPITYVIGKDGKIAQILTPDLLPLREATLGTEIDALQAAKTEIK